MLPSQFENAISTVAPVLGSWGRVLLLLLVQSVLDVVEDVLLLWAKQVTANSGQDSFPNESYTIMQV